ncbi:hypothetical protein EOL96_07420 [Candidatus Saccharibacteria bacterium]|nr:hypothetical protein [Candidatus Saccharibacteria bacterium]
MITADQIPGPKDKPKFSEALRQYLEVGSDFPDVEVLDSPRYRSVTDPSEIVPFRDVAVDETSPETRQALMQVIRTEHAGNFAVVAAESEGNTGLLLSRLGDGSHRATVSGLIGKDTELLIGDAYGAPVFSVALSENGEIVIATSNEQSPVVVHCDLKPDAEKKNRQINRASVREVMKREENLSERSSFAPDPENPLVDPRTWAPLGKTVETYLRQIR